MKKFIKKIAGAYTHYAMTSSDFTGIRITLSESFASMDTLYCHYDKEHTEISEEEFMQAFSTATEMINRNLPVFA